MERKTHEGVDVSYEAPDLVILGTARDLTEGLPRGNVSDGLWFLEKTVVSSSAG